MNSALIERRNERFGSGVRLGIDPPIKPERPRQPPTHHRRVSFNWLAGTVLTGVLGAALVTAAIYAALDQRVRFAEAPQAPAPATHKPAEADEEGPQTGDRLLQPVDIVAAKQTFKTPTTIKVGDKEVVRLKEFTRVSTTLVQTDTGAADVPPFDPLQLQKDAKSVDQQPDPGPAPDDADVSFVAHDLDASITADPTRTLSLEEVQAQVTEHLKNAIAAGNKPVLPIPSQLLLMRTSRAGVEGSAGMDFAGSGLAPANSPFSSIEVRMVPENVTPIARSAGDAVPRPTELKLVTLKHGMSLDATLKANGATSAQAHAIVAALTKMRGGPAAGEGQRVKLTIADIDGNGKMVVARVAIYSDDRLVASVAMGDNGTFLPITDGAAAQTAKQQSGKGTPPAGGLRLYDSLYQSALKQAISRPVIAELIKVFANDVDFQRPVGNGDSFETFYANAEQAEGRDELLYAAITSHGETYRYYRFQTPDDGTVDYYDPTGRSTRKFLIRKPINGGEPTSPFGYRVHPILGYVRMHTGQDWGAPTGTQIFAAGNGTIIKAGFSAGYGRHIEIQHAHGYVTTYSHMSGFARGVAEGARVRQGQVIGYVGTTGSSTGSHLHYEVLINGRFVDPMGIKLPRTREFDGHMLAQFKHERERIDGLMAKAPSVGDVAPMVADVTH